MTKASIGNHGLLIGMDSNAHSKVWGFREDSRGEMILEFVAKHNLYIENVGKEMTFSSPLGSSVIDLTISKVGCPNTCNFPYPTGSGIPTYFESGFRVFRVSNKAKEPPQNLLQI